MKLLIVGCGYVGREVRKVLPAAWKVQALTRTADRRAELKNIGVEPVVANWLEPASLRNLPQVDYVLISVPHRPVENLAEKTHLIGIQNLVEHLPGGWQKLIYLSTTGVFGDYQSEPVDEQTPVSPTRIGARIAVAAEEWIREKLPPHSCVILRLAGIYGPGRIPLAAKLRAGEPLAVPQQGFLNLVHVADIAQVIERLLSQDMRGNLYVLSDGKPTRRVEFYQYLANLCGVPQPEFIEPEPTDSRVRRATSKRVNPSRIVQELSYQYRFPDYRIGLQDAVRGD